MANEEYNTQLGIVMKNNFRIFLKSTLIVASGVGALVCMSPGFSVVSDAGRVGFWGSVSDVSCTISLNGMHTYGNGEVWLAPVSLTELRNQTKGTFIKPRPFKLILSHCLLHPTDNDYDRDVRRYVEIRWGQAYIMERQGQQSVGYLVNTLRDGASNIYLALATNGQAILDKHNKIVPTDPLQNQVPIINGDSLTYYIGYVTENPLKVTPGPIIIHATWEITYY